MGLIVGKKYKFRVYTGEKVITFEGTFLEEDLETCTFTAFGKNQRFNKDKIIYYEETEEP